MCLSPTISISPSPQICISNRVNELSVFHFSTQFYTSTPPAQTYYVSIPLLSLSHTHTHTHTHTLCQTLRKVLVPTLRKFSDPTLRKVLVPTLRKFSAPNTQKSFGPNTQKIFSSNTQKSFGPNTQKIFNSNTQKIRIGYKLKIQLSLNWLSAVVFL